MTYRQAGYGVAGVLGLLAAYYVAPFALAIISLGEICVYSPAGTSFCDDGTTVSNEAPRLPSGFPGPGEKLCRKRGVRYTGTTAQGANVCFTLTRTEVSGSKSASRSFARAAAHTNRA